ncbi:MAG: ABC transporter permease [Verrucomicrobiales bacterium]|jgi:putative ABC transport system permease protein|nr:ABC transporter permease [Verrucomicrobiales bacterium]
MLTQMIFHSWHRNPRRTALTVTTVFLATALISALLAITVSVGDQMARELKSYGANILLEPAVDGDYLDTQDLPRIKEIFWRHNILGFAPLLAGTVTADDGGEVAILGTFFDQPLPVEGEDDFHTGQKIIAPYWRIDGAWPDDARPEALAGARLAERRGWRVGQTLTLAGARPVVLSGILESGGEEDELLVVPLALAQELLGRPGRADAARVSALTVPENRLSAKARANRDALTAEEYDVWYCTAYVSSIAHQLEEALPGARARPVWQVAASEGVIVGKVQLLLLVATLAALLAAAMGVAALTAGAILERAAEIALLKALAARPRHIALLFHAEVTVSALLGGALGCGAGWLLARHLGQTLFGAPLAMAWITVPGVLALAVAIALLGAWLPVRQIAALAPAEVLHGRR